MIYQGNCLTVLREQFAAESVQCCVTSPPYWGLRDYGVEGQLGLEKTPEEYVAKMVAVFREVRRVLRDDGTLWLNLGDSYAGSMKGANGDGTWQDRSACKQGTNKGALNIPPQKAKEIGLKNKDLVGIPWRVAFALQSDGWYLRSDIIWHKPNPMPESVTDRPTKAHEYLFLLSKTAKYYYDAESIADQSVTPIDMQVAKRNKRPHAGQSDPGGKRETTGGFDKITKTYETRNKRTVWTVPTQPYSGAHFATFPPSLIEPCVLAGCPSGGLVLDPFSGSGTTIQVAQQLGRQGVGIELNPAYIALAETRTAQTGMAL